MNKHILILSCIVGMSVFFVCSCSKYGITEIKTSNGNKVYFKREARGLDHDVTILSSDGDYCREYNNEFDYNLAVGSSKFYLLDNDTLHVIVDLNDEQLNNRLPKKNVFPIPVYLINLQSEKGQEIIKNNRDRIKEVVPTLDNNLWCIF